MGKNIFCCRIDDNSENPDITAELLTALELDFSSWVDREHQQNLHFTYSKTETAAQKIRKDLSRLSQEWYSMGVDLAEITVFPLRREDWAETWKKFFAVEKITPHLVIKPSWKNYQAEHPDEIIVEIDPGMSFGTGRHTTTHFCLRMLESLRERGEKQSCLDAGCGSGILTIAAVKLGYHPVAACDIDPICLASTQENLARNGIRKKTVKLLLEDLCLLVLKQHYDAIYANILAPVLLKNCAKLILMLNPGGHLILLGIMNHEFPEVRKAFISAGLTEICVETKGEWTSGVFQLLSEQ